MKRTIKITNKALQYLYVLVWSIKAKDIDSVRKVNRIYKSIEPLVIEFEQEGKSFSMNEKSRLNV